MSVFNINWRKNVVTKKLFRYSLGIPRYLFYAKNSNNSFYGNMPILANSIPKSGTYLLINILKELPFIRDWGNFLASTPSFTFKELTTKEVKQKINYFVPHELIGAHLFYDQEVNNYLKNKNIIHFFIYRDPRDIVISEAHYLTEMNRWHYLHRYFKAQPDLESRINLSINGIDKLPGNRVYPDIYQRYSRFLPWIHNEHVFAMKYEDLVLHKRNQIFENMYEFLKNHYKNKFTLSKDYFLELANNGASPKNSHTFRSGKTGTWKKILTTEQKKRLKDLVGNILIDLDYESDMDWGE